MVWRAFMSVCVADQSSRALLCTQNVCAGAHSTLRHAKLLKPFFSLPLPTAAAARSVANVFRDAAGRSFLRGRMILR